MSVEQLHDALTAGREAAERASIGGARLFIGGEMGIGNTTSAAAVACSLLGLPAAQLAGPGTGLDAAGVARKALTIERATGPTPRRPAARGPATAGRFRNRRASGRLPALRPTRGSGAGGRLHRHYRRAGRRPGTSRIWRLGCSMRTVPPNPATADCWTRWTRNRCSIWDMRLGEGSGAAVAMPILRAAAALHARMATFAEAGVSQA
jgi:nicotinate-nucleotide--dimethylbenzimidazole phosphoribosyltransferase